MQKVADFTAKYEELDIYNQSLQDYGFTITFADGTVETFSATNRDYQLLELGNKDVMIVAERMYIYSPYYFGSPGIYFLKEDQNDSPKVLKLEFKLLTKELKQLDEKIYKL